MTWTDLQIGILEEFVSTEGYRVLSSRMLDAMIVRRDYAAEHQALKADPQAWAWKCAGRARNRLAKRCAVAAERPPCPHCGGGVERMGRTGTVPKYCTPKCMQAAKFRRWCMRKRAA